MITVIVTFQMPPGTTRDDAAAIFRSTAPRYRDMPGLVRKYYLFGEDGRAGGVYLWRDRAAAELAYGPEWRRLVAEKYGVPPTLAWFDTPVIVDNAPELAGITEHHPG
jgi:hypothetical protein